MILRRFEMYSFEGSDAAVADFARAARECARYIPEVLYSATGRISGTPPLNFAWEQAYASPESYRRYMEHPFPPDLAARVKAAMLPGSGESRHVAFLIGVLRNVSLFCQRSTFVHPQCAARRGFC